MTERQYKTLRKLLSLWIAVVVRRRYSIFQNLLLILSIGINVFLLTRAQNLSETIKELKQPIEITEVVGVDIEDALDLSKYKSIAYPAQTLLTRYNKVHKRYMDYKSRPDKVYFNKNGGVDRDFHDRCKRELVRIMNIKYRLAILEALLLRTYPEKTDRIYELLNKYEEPLADMSNYYSKFMSTSVYDGIVKAYD